jgi:hypothetical protein
MTLLEPWQHQLVIQNKPLGNHFSCLLSKCKTTEVIRLVPFITFLVRKITSQQNIIELSIKLANYNSGYLTPIFHKEKPENQMYTLGAILLQWLMLLNTSSMKITEGCRAVATANKAFINFSPSPTCHHLTRELTPAR